MDARKQEQSARDGNDNHIMDASNARSRALADSIRDGAITGLSPAVRAALKVRPSRR